MAHDRETLWTAEANRWNIGKLIVGVLFASGALQMMLGLMVLVGAANFPNAHPAIHAHPVDAIIRGAILAVLTGLAFAWLERRRQLARPA